MANRKFSADNAWNPILLLSAQGRVAVVETKLATNPDLRRRVLAQALDYLTHLADSFADELPAIPADETGQPIADADDIRESVAQGDMLVIIASDEIDPRVAKLSRSLLADHLVKQWDLALIDIALYRPLPGAPDQYVVVPHLRNLIESELRQVVRVIVEGDTPSARVEVERITVDERTPPGLEWNEKRFLDNLEAEHVPTSVRELAFKLRDLARRFPDSIRLAWGRGRDGSMMVKRHNRGLIEMYGSGWIKFRLPLFTRALGEDAGEEYRRALEQLIPAATRMEYPRVPVEQAANVAPALYDLIQQTIERVEGSERRR